jgi:hypothetical protein
MFSRKHNNFIPIISDKFRRNDTNLVYLFTNARDEPNIAEWVAHHILLGFDKIFVFDHLSSEPISSKIKTDFNGKLSIIRVNGSGNIKVELMKNAVSMSVSHNASWMLYLDADEFLVLNKTTNVKDYLNAFKQADSIGINWLMFGSSGFVNQPQGLLTENFIRSEIRLNQHVKSFVRPHTVKSISTPHSYIITHPNRCYSGNKTKMNMSSFNFQPLPFINSAAYIAHYYIQSEEEHMRRKNRQMDDGTGTKTGLCPVVKTIYNNVANTQLKNKYSNGIKELLKTHDIVL